jgi:fumarate reductase subunit C
MYEKKKEPIASSKTYYLRIAKSLFLATFLLAICLGIGIIGYEITENMNFVDALLNSSMLLSGMGPVKTDLSEAGKWFASFYALFSGVMFITNIGIILAPAIHRIYHKLHFEG